jgi:hypothetical protein
MMFARDKTRSCENAPIGGPASRRRISVPGRASYTAHPSLVKLWLPAHLDGRPAFFWECGGPAPLCFVSLALENFPQVDNQPLRSHFRHHSPTCPPRRVTTRQLCPYHLQQNNDPSRASVPPRMTNEENPSAPVNSNRHSHGLEMPVTQAPSTKLSSLIATDLGYPSLMRIRMAALSFGRQTGAKFLTSPHSSPHGQAFFGGSAATWRRFAFPPRTRYFAPRRAAPSFLHHSPTCPPRRVTTHRLFNRNRSGLIYCPYFWEYKDRNCNQSQRN